MPSIKDLFATPKKAVVTILCIGIVLATIGVCIAIYAAHAAPGTEESWAIGGEAAKSFAFADAGVDPVEAQAVSVRYQRFQERFVYGVEFIAGDTEYSYKIDAADGSVVNKESKTVKGPEDSGALPGTVGLEQAREAALADAGLTREQVTFTRVEQDEEGGIPVYEFGFFAGNMEYEYMIDARTGTVYSKKTVTYVAQPTAPPTQSAAPRPTAPAQSSPPAQPSQDATPQPTPSAPPQQGGDRMYIGIDAARSAALADAGVAAGEARFTQARMDYEDGTAVYQLGFHTATHEYEYEIDARTGAVNSRSIEARR